MINPGTCRQRTDCDDGSSGALTSSSSMARGGVGIVQIFSMFVTVGVRVERNFWEWLNDLSME